MPLLEKAGVADGEHAALLLTQVSPLSLSLSLEADGEHAAHLLTQLSPLNLLVSEALSGSGASAHGRSRVLVACAPAALVASL